METAITIILWITAILSMLSLLLNIADLTSEHEITDRPRKLVKISAAENTLLIVIAVLFIRDVLTNIEWLAAILLLLWFGLLFAEFAYSRRIRQAEKEKSSIA